MPPPQPTNSPHRIHEDHSSWRQPDGLVLFPFARCLIPYLLHIPLLLHLACGFFCLPPVHTPPLASACVCPYNRGPSRAVSDPPARKRAIPWRKSLHPSSSTTSPSRTPAAWAGVPAWSRCSTTRS